MNAMLIRKLAVIVLGCMKRNVSIADIVRNDGREELDVVQRVRVAADFLLLERLREPSVYLIDSPRQLALLLDLFSPKFLSRRLAVPWQLSERIHPIGIQIEIVTRRLFGESNIAPQIRI